MPETITVNKELGIIEILSYGDVTYEDTMASVATLKRLKDETGITQVLSDARKQKNVPDTTDIFEFASSLPRDMKIAIIVSADQPTVEDVSFVDAVASNRGAVIKLVTSRQQGLDWLKS